MICAKNIIFWFFMFFYIFLMVFGQNARRFCEIPCLNQFFDVFCSKSMKKITKNWKHKKIIFFARIILLQEFAHVFSSNKFGSKYMKPRTQKFQRVGILDVYDKLVKLLLSLEKLDFPQVEWLGSKSHSFSKDFCQNQSEMLENCFSTFPVFGT